MVSTVLKTKERKPFQVKNDYFNYQQTVQQQHMLTALQSKNIFETVL